MESLAHSFNLESYKQIRAEVTGLLARIENLFRYSLVVMATVFAWLIVQAFGLTESGATCLKLPREVLTPAWFIPPAFVVLCGLLVLAAYVRVRQMGAYLEKCETALGVPDLSWERHLAPQLPIFATITAVCWALMIAAAFFGAQQGHTILEQKLPSCTQAASK